MAATTFPRLLDALVREDAARPLVTFYDDATGERVELSVATYANWVAKTASLLGDELDVGHGDTVRLDLPVHWLGPVCLGAVWTLGARVSDTDASGDLVICGPASLQRHAGQAESTPVLASSLRPLGGRFEDPLPSGVVDFGAVVLAQPDVYAPVDPPEPSDEAWTDGTSQADLLAAAADGTVRTGGRLLTDANPCTRDGARTLLAPLQRSASTVWVAHPDESVWDSRVEQERITDQLR
ncbi:MAG TPA: TIGR03089 family protein [Nocardioidaceae bacterium]|nr:TIGR03089 family protein [Nocardioidaceae bacterium]